MEKRSSRLMLRLLGGFELARGSGAPVTIARRKSQALLAYLALSTGQRHLRDKLAALFWPDVEDRQARQSLRQALLALRQVLAPSPPSLLIEDEAVGLEVGALDIDVQAFERAVADATPSSLHEAARLYRGELLEGLGVSEPPFEEWLLAERERLRELAVEALGRLLAHHMREEQDEAAIATALRLLALDPLQEAVHRALMRIHARQGRQDAALRQYQVCVDVLQRELGIEPEPETRELYRTLLGRRASGTAEASSPTTAPARPPSSARPRGESGITPLIGREGELARLGEVLDEVFAGRGRLVAVLGEAGIGKSRLAAELVSEAGRRGARTLVGRAHLAEQALLYGPWVDALRAGSAIDDVLVRERLGPVWRAELARLFPEIHSGHRPPADPVDQVRLFEGIAQLIQALAASSPVALLLEDVHWADDTSLRLLGFLARRVAASPVVLAVTARDDELDAVPVMRGLLREPSVTRLALRPLSREETASLVGSLGRTGREPGAVEMLAEQVWTASAGNPFVAVESMRALDAGAAPLSPGALPRSERVRELVTARLERLSERGRQLASLSAVIGREFDIALLQRAAGLEEAEVLEGVEELVRRRVLVAVGDRLDVVHDWVREVVYAELLPPRRRALHRQVGEALEAIHAGELDEHAAALGAHYRAAEVWDKAVKHLRAAGARATYHSAYREAVLHYEGAVAALDRLPEGRRGAGDVIDLLIEARHPLAVLGESGRIEPLLRDAERLAEGASDQARLAQVLRFRAFQHWARDEYPAGTAALDRVFAIAGSGAGRCHPAPIRRGA